MMSATAAKYKWVSAATLCAGRNKLHIVTLTAVPNICEARCGLYVFHPSNGGCSGRELPYTLQQHRKTHYSSITAVHTAVTGIKEIADQC